MLFVYGGGHGLCVCVGGHFSVVFPQYPEKFDLSEFSLQRPEFAGA